MHKHNKSEPKNGRNEDEESVQRENPEPSSVWLSSLKCESINLCVA